MYESSREGDIWTPMHRDQIDAHTMDIVRALINDTPNLPVHVHKLLEIVSDEGSDSLEVANAASADPGLVSKILRVVNSTYYCLSNKTDNIHFAIVFLGFNEVRKIALQTSFSSMFKEGKGGEGYETAGLWEHSYLVSICADTIGRAKDSKHAGELLTFGILHDIGKFALLKLALAMKKKGVAPYRSITDQDISSVAEKEEALFRVNHAIVGSMLVEKWELSKRICSVIEYHHNPSFSSPDTIPPEYLEDVATICIADGIVNHVSGKLGHPEPPKDFFDIIGLVPPFENCITDDLMVKLEDAKRFVGHIK